MALTGNGVKTSGDHGHSRKSEPTVFLRETVWQFYREFPKPFGNRIEFRNLAPVRFVDGKGRPTSRTNTSPPTIFSLNFPLSRHEIRLDRQFPEASSGSTDARFPWGDLHFHFNRTERKMPTTDIRKTPTKPFSTT